MFKKLFQAIYVSSLVICSVTSVRCQFRLNDFPSSTKSYIGFRFDDDFLFLGNRDEQYTGGLEIDFLHQIKTKVKRNLFNPFSGGRRYFSVNFGSELYTPYNVSDSVIILNDRPFSSFIYTSFGLIAQSKTSSRKIIFDFYFGVMGSDLPGKIQDKIHTIGDSPPANGWNNKLMNTETILPNFRLIYQRNILIVNHIKPTLFNSFGLKKIHFLNLGYYTSNLGVGLRSSLRSHFDSSEAKHTIQLKKPIKKSSKARWELYGQGLLELVGRNTSLQGLPWMDSPYTINRDEIIRHVWTIELGINLNYKQLYLNYHIKARSKEFIKYSKTWHSWASISIGRKI